MELWNGSGKTITQRYDGVEYVFPPGESVSVSDDAGKFILQRQERRGLENVKFGDDPKEVGYRALSHAQGFAREQIAVHEAWNAQQVERKLQPLAAPDGVKEAERDLKVYDKVLPKLHAERQKAETEAHEKAMHAAITKSIELPDVDSMDIEELRKTLKELGGEPAQFGNRTKLITEIKELFKAQGEVTK